MYSDATITGIFTVLGAAIGFCGGIVGVWLMQKWTKKHDLEMLIRAKGEDVVECLAKHLGWTVESLQKTLSGEEPGHSPEIYRIHALVEAYFPEQFKLVRKITTETQTCWGYFLVSANSIKNDPKTLAAISQNAVEKLKPLAEAIGTLEKELVSKLRINS